MTTECSYNLSYNNSSNIYTLTTASHFYKTRLGQTDRQTNRQTDIVTYRAAIAAKKQFFFINFLHQNSNLKSKETRMNLISNPESCAQ